MSDKNSLMGKGEESKKNIKEINISIDAFGRLERNMKIDKVNSFLNKNLEDKKLTKGANKSIKGEEE